jgi:hypothetical protein
MRRDLWLGLGIAGVAGLLMCAGTGRAAEARDDAAGPEPLLAQSGGEATATSEASPSAQVPLPQGTGGSGGAQAPTPATEQGTPQGTGGAGAANTGMSTPQDDSNPFSPSAEPNPAPSTSTPNPNAAGTGGTGNAQYQNPGVDPNAPPPNPNTAGTGGTGNTGTASPEQAPAPASPGGIAVVDAIYRGTVRSVSSKEVVIEDAGSRVPLEIGKSTRIVRDGESIRATQLEQGETVRAVVNLVGRSHTREITVMTPAEARKEKRDAARR